MNKKLNIALVFGGKSVEHEVSVRSAKSLLEAIPKNKYQVSLIGIDKSGAWRVLKKLTAQRKTVEPLKNRPEDVFLSASAKRALMAANVIFPVLHGSFGEDGTVQGFFKLLNKPFVGAGVLGSALGMDKEVQKRLLRDAGIKTAKFLVCHSHENGNLKFAAVKKNLGLPFFVKPANSGSSVGVSKVRKESEFKPALRLAFKYDTKILIEEFIDGREIECSVLGNTEPIASLPGEIIPSREFYSYSAKYLDDKGAILRIPADLDKSLIKKIQTLAVRTFKTLECSGMARVDFFLQFLSSRARGSGRGISGDSSSDRDQIRNDGEAEILVNEINTIPGFTSISMYPKLWEASGLSYPKLIDKLIKLAVEKFRNEEKLETSFSGQ